MEKPAINTSNTRGTTVNSTEYALGRTTTIKEKTDDKYSNLNLANAAYKHDQIMADKAQEDLKIKLGVLGRFFGHEENSSKNITFVLLVILLIIIIVITFCFSNRIIISSFVNGMWDNIFPIITLSLGYIFGKK